MSLALEAFAGYQDNHHLRIVVGSLFRLWQATQDDGIQARVATVLGVEA